MTRVDARTTTIRRRSRQRAGFGQHTGSDVLLEHVGRGDVDRHREDLFGFATEGDEIEESPAGLEIDEEVDVTRAVGTATGRRSKDAQVPDAMLSAGGKQR
jgi:hypothetical protein